MTQPAGQGGLTMLGKLVIAIVVAGLLYFGYQQLQSKQPAGGTPSGPVAKTGSGGGAEGPDNTQVTTFKEYKYVPAEKLPPIKGASKYQWDSKEKVVQFPINVWIGWLPIVAANHGFSPNTESIFFKKYGFKVNLKLIDDPVQARDAYAAGSSHILWGTLDMIVLMSEELAKDSRTAPRVFQQIDWSSGGDGIVARSAIKSIRDLKGKTIVYALNSPSQYYINNLLLAAGLNPAKDVTHKTTATAFEAAAAFVADKSIDACVSWAPDIYNIAEKVPGTHLLSTTKDANKLIADVWAVRADFAKDHPEVVKGLVEGIFYGMQMLKDRKSKDFTSAVAWMAEGYHMKPEDIMGMVNDAHSTNFAENRNFFLNQNNPANFERTWNSVSFVYKEMGIITGRVRFDEVMDFSVLQALEAAGTFARDKDESTVAFAPTQYKKVSAEQPILTQTLRIQFFPNSWDLKEPARDEAGKPVQGQLYDPNVDFIVERAGKLGGQFAAARVAIVGHTDGSKKGQVSYDVVKQLSLKRAEAVRDALIKKYHFDPNKFVVEGKAWDEPADAADKDNHFKNRRVDISVYQPEANP